MGKITKLRALVIDSERERSRQLKYMLSLIHGYKEVYLAKDLASGVTSFEEDEEHFNIIILAIEEGSEKVKSFIETIQEKASGKPVVFFGIFRNSDDELSPEEALLLGIHGYVETPFSVDQLQERTHSAIVELEKLRIERSQKVIQDVIASSCDTLDHLSLFIKSGLGAGQMIKSMREQRKILNTLDQEFIPYLLETVINTYSDRELPKEDGLPPGLSPEEKTTVKTKLSELHEDWFYQRSQQGETFSIKARGNINTPRAVAYLENIISQLSNQDMKTLTLDFSDATTIGNGAVFLAIKQIKAFKDKDRSLYVTGDNGQVKAMIQKIKEKKQRAGA